LTLKVIWQLPLAGILAFARVTPSVALVRLMLEPVQVVAGAGIASSMRLAGNVSVRPDCVRAKGLEFLSVIVSTEVAFGATLAGEKAASMVGADGVTVIGAGQAFAALPPEDGPEVVAMVDVNVTVSVSVLPEESVTVTRSVPGPFQVTIACGVVVPAGTLTAPVALHA
jgi:hypothetical protein